MELKRVTSEKKINLPEVNLFKYDNDNIYIRCARELNVIPNTDASEQKRFVEMTKYALKSCSDWEKGLPRIEKVVSLVANKYEAQEVNCIPFTFKQYNKIFGIEHNFKFHWNITISVDWDRFRKESRGFKEVLYGIKDFNHLCLDVLWNACLMTYLSVNYGYEKKVFTGDAVKNTIETLFRFANIPTTVNYERLASLYGQAYQTAYNNLYNRTFGKEEFINRTWLEIVADELNYCYKEKRYIADDIFRGNSCIPLRESILMSEWFQEEMLSRPSRSSQVEFIKEVLIKYPELKQSAYSWLIRSCEEIIINGEQLLKPWAEGERAEAARLTLATKIENGEVDKHKKHIVSDKQKLKYEERLNRIKTEYGLNHKISVNDRVWLSSRGISVKDL